LPLGAAEIRRKLLLPARYQIKREGETMRARMGVVVSIASSVGLFAVGCDDAGVEPTAPDDVQQPVDGLLRAGARGERKASLGKLLFEDTSLSASGTESCASCHQASSAFTGNNDPARPTFPVALGAFPTLVGSRNAPTAMYMAFSPIFSFVEDDGDLTPTGGQFWDGRADTLAEQAKGPFVNPREMALPDHASVIERIRVASYAPLFRSVYGFHALDDVEEAYDHLADAIAAFERTSVFAPFSSKFDAYLRGCSQLTDAEARGFALFTDPEKGNCIACHAGDVDSRDPRDWLFTDFTYDNLGVPRNSDIPDNDDPTHFDLGLCARAGLADKLPSTVTDPAAFVAALCGAFKVPTLRNIARTAPYMHNGYFEDLRDVVAFYATRDTTPERWYPVAEDGTVSKFDDLPEAYRANVNTEEAPYDRQPGDAPRLSAAEIDDVVAFLGTLSDGYE
jgi:cytochrome c peroxidase